MLELRLQNLSSGEIAERVARSTRTIRRTLQCIKALLTDRLRQVQILDAEMGDEVFRTVNRPLAAR